MLRLVLSKLETRIGERKSKIFYQLNLQEENMTKANKCLQFLDIAKDIGMMMILWMHIWDNKPIEFTPEFINYFISTPYTPLFFHTFRISYQHR